MNAPLDPKAAERLPYCGGTDAAAIVCSAQGLPYYRSAWEVWAERHAPEALPPRDATEQSWLDLGNALERYILDRYERERAAPEGLTLEIGGRVRGPEQYPWMRGNKDGGLLDADGYRVGIVDAKSSRLRSHWIEYTDDGERIETHPAGYQVQGQWYLGLDRLECARAGNPVLPRFIDLAALDLMGADLIIRRIDHDEQTWGGIASTVIAWWERHIIGGQPPPNDHSECCLRWHLYCKPRRKSERVADEAEEALIRQSSDLRAKIKRLDQERRQADNDLLSRMDTDRLTVGGPAKEGHPYVQVQGGDKRRHLRLYRFTTKE